MSSTAGSAARARSTDVPTLPVAPVTTTRIGVPPSSLVADTGPGPGSGLLLLGRRLAALAAGGLVLGGGPALGGVAPRAALLAAVAGRIGRVGDLRRPLLGHALVLERLVLV